jgi:hypothetical protein
MAITNQEAILINHPNAEEPPSITDCHYQVTDVVVLNHRNVGTAMYSGYGYGSGRYWTRAYGGYTLHNSISFGDLVFMVLVSPRITFSEIADPNDVRNLVLSVMRH